MEIPVSVWYKSRDQAVILGSRGLPYAGERHCFPHPADGLQHAV